MTSDAIPSRIPQALRIADCRVHRRLAASSRPKATRSSPRRRTGACAASRWTASRSSRAFRTVRAPPGRIGSCRRSAPAKWTGVRDALAYGPSAPQTRAGRSTRNASPLAVAAAGLPAESEDCLVLNVWTPAVDDGRKRPVMFWCHGGGFATGSGSSPVTEGANLARAATSSS